MHHTTKFLSKIIGIFTASFLIFAPNVASAAMPTAVQIYDFYDSGGPNCWASNAEDFCANWTGCSAYGWWEYRASFCYDGIEVDASTGNYPSYADVYPPTAVVDNLGLSYGSFDSSMMYDMDAEQIIQNGETNNYSADEMTCLALFSLYDNGAVPLIDIMDDSGINNITWWNGETVYDPLVQWRLSYNNYDIFEAIKYAIQQAGTAFPEDGNEIESHASYAMSRLGVECEANWQDISPRPIEDYQLTCGSFDDIYIGAENVECPSTTDDLGAWIMAMYPEGSWASETLSTLYNQTELYNAFCEQNLSTKYDIANAAGVQDVDSCGFGAGSGTNSYVVTYDLQGGSWGATPTTQTVTYGSSWSIIFDSYPSKSGYTFGGFYTSANCGGTKYVNAGSSSDWQLTSARNWDKTSNTTLYACWISNTTYTITLDMQGGSVGTTNLTISAKYGQPFTYIYNTYPAKSGYTYGGFYTGTNCTGTQYIGVDSPSTYQLTSIRNWDKASNTTLYACWRSESGNDHNLTCADIYEFYDNGGPRCYTTQNDMLICNSEIEVCMDKQMYEHREAFCDDGQEYDGEVTGEYAISSNIRAPIDAAENLGLDCSNWTNEDGYGFWDLAAQNIIYNGEYATNDVENLVEAALDELYSNCANIAVTAEDINNPKWWNEETCQSNECNWILSYDSSTFHSCIYEAKQNYGSSSQSVQAQKAAECMGYNMTFSINTTCPTPPMSCDAFDTLYINAENTPLCPNSTDEIGGWLILLNEGMGYAVEWGRQDEQIYQEFCGTCSGSKLGGEGCMSGDIAQRLGLDPDECNFEVSEVTTYSLAYTSISDAMSQAASGNQNCYGDQNGNGPVLVRCDCRTSVANLTGEPEFLYEIEMPSFAQTNCPTSGVPESSMAGLSCSLSGTFGDYSQGRLLCVSQDVVNAATDGCADLCGCGNPWNDTTVPISDEFFDEYDDVCVSDSYGNYWCNRTSSDTSYIFRQIAMTGPEYMPGCYANETVLYGCAANMYYDNSGNADDGAWCSDCPSYTLADGTTAPGSLAALTHSPAITQCTVPTTSILRGTNGNYKYKNACAYTK